MTAPFSTFAALAALLETLPDANVEAAEAAAARNAVLTKPPGALGRLEDLALWYASWRGEAAPRFIAPQVLIFAGNHGIAARGVSAFPQEVTMQMVANFEAEGAAINQLAKELGARFAVVSLELDRPTADFTEAPAMSEEECIAALAAGWDAVDPSADLLIPGEMGIANTTSAAALACSLIGGDAEDWVGRGTGVDDAGLARKAETVRLGCARHAGLPPLGTLAALGGREIAAMAGAMFAARQHRIPVLLDGFIASSAAAVLHAISPKLITHLQAGHVSAEAAHARLLRHLGLTPILDLGLRLGEGSGAATAGLILKAALACHSGMATFAEAGVADG